ncbi:MAG: Dyp-type peroxidase [Polyangiaceae bacterium]
MTTWSMPSSKFKQVDAAKARRALARLGKERVTSALKQSDEARKMRESKTPGTLFCNVMLTATGYAALGRDPQQLVAKDMHFALGMKSEESRRELGDPSLDAWEPNFRRPVDLLVVLADDNLDTLRKEEKELVQQLAEVAELQFSQRGQVIRKGDQRLEPFGFADGRSQPIFLKDDMRHEGPTEHWDPAASLDLVLLPDPFVNGAFGSFYVLRKLEQDVSGFLEQEAALAKALGLPPAKASALAMGRFRDGTPVHLEGKQTNDFVFDPADGSRCPFHAHIRKANTRNALEKGRRIARRGIPYDDRSEEVQRQEARPKAGVGLLFSSFQASIEAQFTFIHRFWMNNPGFPSHRTGKDPLSTALAEPGAQKWPPNPGGSERVGFDFGRVVHMKGGEFFFAPSLPFLKQQ